MEAEQFPRATNGVPGFLSPHYFSSVPCRGLGRGIGTLIPMIQGRTALWPAREVEAWLHGFSGKVEDHTLPC